MAAQSEAAKEFLRLKETLTNTDISLMIAEIKAAKKEWDERQLQLDQFNQSLTSLTTQIQTKEQLLADKRKQNNQADRMIEKINKRY